MWKSAAKQVIARIFFSQGSVEKSEVFHRGCEVIFFTFFSTGIPSTFHKGCGNFIKSLAGTFKQLKTGVNICSNVPNVVL